MYTPFLIGFNQQNGPYAHFGYCTLVSDPKPNKSKELARIYGKSANLAKCSQLFKKGF